MSGITNVVEIIKAMAVFNIDQLCAISSEIIPGPLDDAAGRLAYSAIKEFQIRSGIPVDTTVDEVWSSIQKKKVNVGNRF